MSTKDHNESVAGIHLAAGGFLVFALAIGPLLLIRDLERHTDQIPLAVIGFMVLLALAVFMISTAVMMKRKKPLSESR